MAVLVGLCHQVGADIAARAGLVLDHDGLAYGVLQFRANEAGQDIARSARRKRHDNPHRLCEILRESMRGH